MGPRLRVDDAEGMGGTVEGAVVAGGDPRREVDDAGGADLVHPVARMLRARTGTRAGRTFELTSPSSP